MSRPRGRRLELPPPEETIEKLKNMIDGGNFYEAQQMYKTMCARYASAEKFSEALDVLHSGALIQLQNREVTCGAELALLFVETLVSGKFPYSEETLEACSENGLVGILMPSAASDRINKIYDLFPRIPVPQNFDDDDDDMQKLSEALTAAKVRVEGCSTFLRAAIRWSAEFGAPKVGSPQLHGMIAEYLYSESPELDMAKVSVHFVYGKDPMKFASVLVNFMSKCYPGEDDLAIARATLLYLSQGNLRDANYLIDEVRTQLKSKENDLPKSDLMQFIQCLLAALERDAFPLFNILRQKYKASIERESLFNELLDAVAEKFYGVRRRSGMQGIFGDIFKMM